MVEVTGKLALPLVVLGFYPMVKIIGEMMGGPDIPIFLMFLWSLALAASMLIFYKEFKK